MKNLVAVVAVLALTLAGQCFAEDVDSKHDCKERGGQMDNNGHCMKDGVIIDTAPAVAAPAAAGAASAGALSAGAIAVTAAVVAVAVAVAVTSGNGGNSGTGTTGTH